MFLPFPSIGRDDTAGDPIMRAKEEEGQRIYTYHRLFTPHSPCVPTCLTNRMSDARKLGSLKPAPAVPADARSYST